VFSKLKIHFPEVPIDFQILNNAQDKGGIIHKGAFYFAIYAEHVFYFLTILNLFSVTFKATYHNDKWLIF
jgi:hypothetical protein